MSRLKIFISVHIIFILMWISYLFAIQILDVYRIRSNRVIDARYKPTKKILYATRGNIFDVNGQLLVTTKKYYQVDVSLFKIRQFCKAKNKDKKIVTNKIIDIIAKHTDLSKKYLRKQINLSKRLDSVYIKEKVSSIAIDNIRKDLQNEGIVDPMQTTFSGMNRVYPVGKIAAGLIGSVKSSREIARDSGVSNFIFKGETGLELTFDDLLAGEDGWEQTYRDNYKHSVFVSGLKHKKREQGKNIFLTIDVKMQEIAEKKLLEGLKKYKAKNAICVIMEAKTGAIKVLAGISEDHEKLSAKQIRSRYNIAASTNFEPGSTFKPFTAIMALEQKVVTLDEVINCRPFKTPYRTIRDAHPFTKFTLEDIIAHSSNPGIARIAGRLDKVYFYKKLRELGFGTLTETGIFSEGEGSLAYYTNWTEFSQHSISFGQEISVTALQLIRAYSALANEGKIMKPYILDRVEDNLGNIIFKTEPEVVKTVFDKDNIETVKQFLIKVVEEGTGTKTKFKTFKVAGKTGTAEKSKSGGKGYYEDKFYSSFAGFLPADDPEYIALVVFDEAKSYYHYASESAVPTFKDIFSEIIQLENCPIIPKTKIKEKQFVSVPNLIGKSYQEAKNILNKSNIHYKFVGNKNERIIDQVPKPDTLVEKNQFIQLFSKSLHNENKLKKTNKMPNFVGLTVKEAYEIASINFIKLTVKGNGIITQQDVKAGTKISFETECKVVAK